MSAFGPFAGIELIDFTRLGEAPLFLINGPTGAGKTCILDAICFALYAKTTGNEREPRDMRCDSADAEQLTEVTFEFQLANKRYRIRRVPEQTKPKKHSDGVTKVLSEAQLFELGKGGEEILLVEKKVTDATAEIESRTGLNVDQFRQVMVLPQGQFRQLLMASSADREKIFSQLFQTHAYQKIESALKEQAKGIASKVENHRNKRAGMLQAVEMESDQVLFDAIESFKAEAEIATKLKNKAQTTQQDASKKLESAKLVIGDFDNLATLENDAERLNERTNVIAEHKIVVAMAEQALVFKPILTNKTERLLELSSAQIRYTASQERLNAAKQTLSDSAEQQAQLSEFKKRLSEQIERHHYLNGLGEHLTMFVRLGDELKHVANNKQVAQEGHAQLQKKVADFKQELVGLEEALPLMQQKIHSLDGVRQKKNDVLRMLEVHHQWQQSKQALNSDQETLTQYESLGKSLNEQKADAETTLTQLRVRWHQGQATILARTLSDNELCPVCGSYEHPSPASSDVHVPSDDELKSAETQLKEKDTQLKHARENYSGLKAKIEELIKVSDGLSVQLNSGHSKQELDLQFQTLEQALAEADVLNNDLAIGAAKQKELRESIVTFEQRLANAQEALNKAISQQSTITGQLQTLESQLPSNFRSQQTLNQEIQTTSTSIRSSEQAIEKVERAFQRAEQEHKVASESEQAALARLTETKDKATQVQCDFESQLAQSNFDTEAQIQQYSLTNEQLTQHKLDIETHNQKRQENAALIKQLKERLASIDAPDLSALEQALTESIERYQGIEQEWQEINGELSRLESTVKAITVIDQQSMALEQEYSVVGTLSDVANGQTGNKISLQRFVLSVLLDDVLLAAGERLQIMSKGRYLLLRKQLKAKGNKASGLELEVEDSYTSKTRPVSTLSGGESFMAALSMALGLSDVVQAYAGGIKLDTLFIDEGFGSLDQESLDLAVRTLVDLQSSGRMVGVISHVAELKEQIGIRLDVLKGVGGSKTCLVVP